MITALEVAARLVVVLLVFLTVPLLVGQMEHKAMAHMQGRLGPMYAGGFHGWAQLVADGIKFAQKESVVPKAADKPVYELAPFVALLPYLLVLIVIPWGQGSGARRRVSTWACSWRSRWPASASSACSWPGGRLPTSTH